MGRLSHPHKWRGFHEIQTIIAGLGPRPLNLRSTYERVPDVSNACGCPAFDCASNHTGRTKAVSFGEYRRKIPVDCMWNELLLILFVLIVVIVIIVAAQKKPETLHSSDVYYHNPIHDIGPNAPKSILRSSRDPKNKKHIQFAENRDEIVYNKKTNVVISRVTPPT